VFFSEIFVRNTGLSDKNFLKKRQNFRKNGKISFKKRQNFFKKRQNLFKKRQNFFKKTAKFPKKRHENFLRNGKILFVIFLLTHVYLVVKNFSLTGLEGNNGFGK